MSKALEDFLRLSQKEKLAQLRIWDIAYYEDDAPLISDEEYDECVRQYNASYKKKYISSLGKAGSGFAKFAHPYPVLSLDKVTDKSLFEKRIREFEYKCIIEPKLDGLTVVYYPDGKLVSRGDGHIGEILPNIEKIACLPKPLDKPVRMEAVILKDDYEKYFKGSAKNPRNLAAGILRRKEATEDIQHIAFYAYNILGADDLSESEQLELLESQNFRVPKKLSVTDSVSMEKAFEEMGKWSVSQEYNTDGVVIKADIAKGQKDYGSTSHHPNNAFAYKFISKTKETVVKAIEWSIGRSKFTPVAIFETIELGGAAVSRASLHNLNIIKKLGVKIGSKVSVTLKNEIIPQIISSDGLGEEIELPKECPFCGNELLINFSDEVFCPNPECGTVIIDTMNKLVSRQGLDIAGISEELVRAMFDAADNNVEPFSILEYDADYLEKRIGLSRYMANKLASEITRKRSGVKFENFIYACNIPWVGISTARDIAKSYPDIRSFLESWEKTGKTIEGIGDVTYASITKNLDKISANMKYIKSFKDNGLYVAGKTKAGIIVITGKLSRPKANYMELIEKAGFSYSDSLSRETHYLVAADPEGKSAKLEKARRLGTVIISEEGLMELLKDAETRV